MNIQEKRTLIFFLAFYGNTPKLIADSAWHLTKTLMIRKKK